MYSTERCSNTHKYKNKNSNRRVSERECAYRDVFKQKLWRLTGRLRSAHATRLYTHAKRILVLHLA